MRLLLLLALGLGWMPDTMALARAEATLGRGEGLTHAAGSTPWPTEGAARAMTALEGTVEAAEAEIAPELVIGPLYREAVASYYGGRSGDGFVGNTAACGKVLEVGSFWVAHKSLPCGTLVEIAHGARAVLVRVEDRGPYIHGRELDLTERVKDSLGCSDLCRVQWRVVR